MHFSILQHHKMVKETEQDIREILLSTPEMSKYLTSEIQNIASFCLER